MYHCCHFDLPHFSMTNITCDISRHRADGLCLITVTFFTLLSHRIIVSNRNQIWIRANNIINGIV